MIFDPNIMLPLLVKGDEHWVGGVKPHRVKRDALANNG
jgi:hypothetical protein